MDDYHIYPEVHFYEEFLLWFLLAVDVLKTNISSADTNTCNGREWREKEGETKERKMQIDRGEESSPLLPGLFLARLTGGQQLASALHAETQHCVLSLSLCLPLTRSFYFCCKNNKTMFFSLFYISPFSLYLSSTCVPSSPSSSSSLFLPLLFHLHSVALSGLKVQSSTSPDQSENRNECCLHMLLQTLGRTLTTTLEYKWVGGKPEICRGAARKKCQECNVKLTYKKLFVNLPKHQIQLFDKQVLFLALALTIA